MLAGCPTVPPAEIVIFGAGTFGTEAAMAFAGNRASVYLLDVNPFALERADQLLGGRAVTMAATDYNLRKAIRFADALIGAVYVPGKRTPLLLSREFIRWVVLANLIAWPVAYFVMNRWLQNFAYRTDIGIVVFLVSGGAALVIASLTVSFQAVKSAQADPVGSLRYE